MSLRRVIPAVATVLLAVVAVGAFAVPASAVVQTADAVQPVSALRLPSAAPVSSSAVEAAAQLGLTRVASPTTTPTPSFNQQVQNADKATSKRKLAVGVAAVILAVIVYVGRRIRNRHARKLKNLQNAKT